ncbi:MAG: formylglycine-generating enzyme family protein [Caldilineaceae bacterium]
MNVTSTPTARVVKDAESIATSTHTATSTPQVNRSAPTADVTVDTATAQATATSDATGIDTDTAINPVDGAVYVYVSPGDFTMGSNEGRADEQPAHTVYLDGFWIMQTEVTNGQYAACVEDGACTAPRNIFWQLPVNADRPVTWVSWNQANDYAEWVGGSLPTEAQWEKACRGTDGRVYPWGNTEPSAALLNFGNNGDGITPVGAYPNGAGPNGLLDMAGNVWEWTADWYSEEYYSRSPERNPTGPASGFARVARGGAFYFSAEGARCAFRYGYNAQVAGDFGLGFRVVSEGF